ncbi:hypothetical protein DU74_02220 [Methanosarcina mazei]|uniref:Polysaccharide pyruvyl transferase domain-containing protein n=1 Tax=Methanosarcina mazei TaxID=2209 RepID=A0A0F8P8J3_METMZ|nr:polysaccharide pyruvyl transferase family protein [Methanosarcina mazei]KKH59372.1 hypothetical protein DU74_02220 [Methanosarcina mazei]
MHNKKKTDLKKILFVGATLSKNNGSAAMLISTAKVLKEYIPNTSYNLLSIFPELDSKKSDKYNIKVFGQKASPVTLLLDFIRSMLWKITHVNKVIGNGDLKKYFCSEMVIDLSGDSFSDNSTVLDSLICCYRILICLLLNKPVVIYAQSIGPFKTTFTRLLSRFCLNRVNLLIARDEITVDYLKQIGITNKVYFTADSAFLLNAIPYEKLKNILIKENIDINKRPIIGISASQHIYDLTQETGDSSYIPLMAKIVDYLVEKLNAQVILVPHVTNNDGIVDDRFVGGKIWELAKNKSKIELINNEYSPEILKGIIGLCDMFIGARMHANIAATSMCVPTLAIAYSHKAYGIMKTLDMEKYVLDFRTMNFNDMKSKIDDLWLNRKEVNMKLDSNVKLIKERSFYNGKLVKDLVDSLD